MSELGEKIAKLFENARAEGVLRKWADGKSDAEEVCALIKEAIEKAKISDEEIKKVGNGVRDYYGVLPQYRAVAQAQLDTILKLLDRRGKCP